MNLNLSTAYHPEFDGQTERVNQVIEDMLNMYVMDKPSKWEDYLHLVEQWVSRITEDEPV
jgi:hypothetical protein